MQAQHTKQLLASPPGPGGPGPGFCAVTAADHGPDSTVFSVPHSFTPDSPRDSRQDRLQTSLSLNKLRPTIKAQLQNTFMIYTCMSRSCPPECMPHAYAFRSMAHVIYLDTYRGLPYIPKSTVNACLLTLLPAALLLEKAFPESWCACLRADQTLQLPSKISPWRPCAESLQECLQRDSLSEGSPT